MPFTFLAWGVGSGKTKEALTRAQFGGAKSLLIFAPTVLKTMKHWENEAKKWGVHIPIEVQTYYRLQQYGRADLEHKLPNGGKGYAIIIDECQKVKNSQSQQGLGAFKLVRDNPDADIYLLSGTPASNGYQDFTNYAKMTSFVKNKTDFWKRYVITSNYRGFPEIATYINTAELDQWWAEIADIKAPQIFTSEHDITVDFPSVANELVAKKTRVGVLDGEKYILENASQLTHYCRQAACLTKVRQDWLEQFLDSTEDNVVVFVGYKTAMNDVLKIAKKLKKQVYQVDGDVKSLPTDAETPTLKNAVIAVNYQSGGAGLNLQYANHAVFYSPTYSYADYIQARGRISRRGQEKRCTFYHLQADKSIERDIYDCLKQKEDFSMKLWNAQYADDGESDLEALFA